MTSSPFARARSTSIPLVLVAAALPALAACSSTTGNQSNDSGVGDSSPPVDASTRDVNSIPSPDATTKDGASADASADVTASDAGSDVATAADAGADVATVTDAAPEAAVDAASDVALADAVADSAPDAPVDAAHDVAVDAAPACAPSCPDTHACNLPTDCASGVCTGGACAAPACGPTCPAGNVCGADADCATGECMAGLCVIQPTCAALLGARPSTTSGTYTVGTAASPTSVYCDMAFAGGGWTLIESTNGGACDPGTASPAVVTQGSCTYMPTATMQAIAQASMLVHIRPASGAAAPTSYLTSADATPITNLIAGNILNAGVPLNDPMTEESHWTVTGDPGNAAAQTLTPASILDFGCDVSSQAYPSIYWACNNGTDGFHLVSGHSTWNFSNPTNTPIEVYVK